MPWSPWCGSSRGFCESGNKLLLFGNGGSAADAQHIAAEYVGRFALDRTPLPAVALTTDTSVLTSIANDFGYDEVFAKQVRALGRRGDLAIAISTSGGSRSVLRAVQVCKELGIHTVGLTGGGGGELGTLVDHHLCVCSTAEYRSDSGNPHPHRTRHLRAGRTAAVRRFATQRARLPASPARRRLGAQRPRSR